MPINRRVREQSFESRIKNQKVVNFAALIFARFDEQRIIVEVVVVVVMIVVMRGGEERDGTI